MLNFLSGFPIIFSEWIRAWTGSPASWFSLFWCYLYSVSRSSSRTAVGKQGGRQSLEKIPAL